MSSWRIILKQIDQAIRAERYDEALELIQFPEVADHRKAHQYRDRIIQRLLERAERSLQSGNNQASWGDLQRIAATGSRGKAFDALHSQAVAALISEIGQKLSEAQPEEATRIIERAESWGVEPVLFARVRNISEVWSSARRKRKRGDFPGAIELMKSIDRSQEAPSLMGAERQELEGLLSEMMATRMRLHQSLEKQQWSEVLVSADELLTLAPESPEALSARNEAWHKLGLKVSMKQTLAETIVPSARPARVRPQVRESTSTRFVIWIDGVGGYLVCPGRRVSIGQAAPGATADVAIFGDISRNHALVLQDEEGYMLQSLREVRVNSQRQLQRTLAHNDLIQLGENVLIRFELPSPVSHTARLTLASPHRLNLSLSGILLMSDTLVLGNTSQSHVVVPDCEDQLVIYRQGDQLWCRSKMGVEIDGQQCDGRGVITMSSRVVAGETAFSLEPLGSPLNQI